jgi:hypothetical protein
MKNAMAAVSLVTLLLAPALAAAINVPNLDDYSLRTGYVANYFFEERLRYDADIDQATYSVRGPFRYGNRLCGFPSSPPCVDPPTHLEFDGLFAWTAGIDEYGNVTDPGSMLWLGDFGNGLEALASGRLIGTGAQHYSVDGAPFFTRYSNLHFLFDFSFLDHRVAGMGDQMVLLFEQQIGTLDESIFAQDFECGYHIDTPTFPKCSYYSTSGIVGQRVSVPEPSPIALLVMAAAVLPLFRRGSGGVKPPKLA